jgi:excinuclease ABC subunit B
VTPQSIVKPIDMSLVAIAEADYVTVPLESPDPDEALTPAERRRLGDELDQAMREAARRFEFERAAQLRDRLKSLRALPLYEENPPVGAGGSGAG